MNKYMEMNLCSLNHYTLSLYFISFIVFYSRMDVDRISIVTTSLLFLIFQYKYGMLRIKPVQGNHTYQRCVTCAKMTPQHYVHCIKCKTCVDGVYVHIDFIGFCTHRKNFIVYMYFAKGITFLNLLLCILLSIVYPWTILTVVVHLYVLKSMYVYTYGIINVYT